MTERRKAQGVDPYDPSTWPEGKEVRWVTSTPADYAATLSPEDRARFAAEFEGFEDAFKEGFNEEMANKPCSAEGCILPYGHYDRLHQFDD